MAENQWDLTDEEIAALKDRSIRRRGQIRLLEQLQRLEGYMVEQERAWWEGVILHHGIAENKRDNLIADYELGKIWVKGKVKTLDKQVRTVYRFDA